MASIGVGGRVTPPEPPLSLPQPFVRVGEAPHSFFLLYPNAMDDFSTKDGQPKSQKGQITNHEMAVACGSLGTGLQGQWDSSSVALTGLGPRSAGPTLESDLVYIPQANTPRSPSSASVANNTAKPMAGSLGRTRTLGRIGRTESFSDAFPIPSGPSSVSLLQHRESSAVVNNDDDDDDEEEERTPGSRIRIDINGEDEWEDGTQPLESQDVSMDGLEAPRAEQLASTTTTTTPSPNATLAVNTNASNNAGRFPSPIPTEPDDPDPEYISNQLAKCNIKTRDFAWYPPYTTSAPATDIAAPLSTPTPQHHADASIDVTTPPTAAAANMHSSLLPAVPLTPETFDPYRALGEFEYRLRQNPRQLPIPGKTLRRLIEIGWVTENEAESRCSQEDLDSLEEFDSRNRARLLRIKALQQQRAKDLGAELDEGEELGGYTSTGAYPYLTLKFDSVPTFSQRDELVTGVKSLLPLIDRAIRMAMARERERERDRLEAETALLRRRQADEEKERLEKERVEREVMTFDQDQEMREPSNDNLKVGVIRIPPVLQPPAEISSAPPTSRKRSPNQAWADDEDDMADNDVEDLEVKRLRLARSQSETWYQKQMRLEQEAQAQAPTASAELQQPQPQTQTQASPSRVRPQARRSPRSRPPSRSPRGPTTPSSQSRKTSSPPFQSQSQSQSQSQHTSSRSQSQPTNFIAPEIQYPAPLSTYDPSLYPEAASAIESQSQQPQGRHHPLHINSAFRGGPAGGDDTPPASPADDDGEVEGEGAEGNGKGKGKGKNSVTVGRGIGLTEDGEEDTRPNALKRSPKGVKRGLTRGRTLVQIC